MIKLKGYKAVELMIAAVVAVLAVDAVGILYMMVYIVPQVQ